MRGVVSGKATGADTPWPGAPTARAPTSRRPRSARRRRPAMGQRGGGLPPPGGESLLRQCNQKTHRPPPTGRTRARWRWKMFGTSPARERRWSRAWVAGEEGSVMSPDSCDTPVQAGVQNSGPLSWNVRCARSRWLNTNGWWRAGPLFHRIYAILQPMANKLAVTDSWGARPYSSNLSRVADSRRPGRGVPHRTHAIQGSKF